MDGSRFDDLARTLVSPGSRRGFLGGLAALAASLVGARAAGAQNGCGPDQVNRRGLGCVCRATGRPPGAAGCPCPPGHGRCPDATGVCVDLNNDLANCGACGNDCGAADACSTRACNAGVCGGTTLLADGVQCAFGQICDEGACVGNGACGPSDPFRGGCSASCGVRGNNFCSFSIEDGYFCLGDTFCSPTATCTSSDQCGPGQVCARSTCVTVDSFFCNTVCTAPEGAGVTAAAAATADGPVTRPPGSAAE